MRRLGVWGSLATVVAVALTACGGGIEPTPPKPSSTPRSTAPAATAPAATGKRISCGSKPVDRATTPQQPRLFAPESVWNRPLSPDAPAGDRRLTNAFRADIQRQIEQRIGPWIQTADYSTPLYTVGHDQRCVRVTLDVTQPYGRTLRSAFRRVPLPADARPAAGQDGHLTVWQPSTDSLWEFFKLRRERDGWRASWGGAIQRVSRSPGYFAKSAWPGAQYYWGATATSLPAIAGTMTIRELERGRIDHALAISVPNARAGVHALPARRTDGTLRDPGAIPEGARFRLDPDLDLDRLRMPPVVRTMAVAAQRYGLIVRDKTLRATGFYAEDPTPFAALHPYRGLFEGKLPSVLLQSFPWQHIQAMPLTLRRSPAS